MELLAEFGYEYDASVFPTDKVARRLCVPVATLTALHRPVVGSSFLELPLPDHRPSPFPVHPSYSLLFGMPYFRWGLRRSRVGRAPFVLLFHLTDVADPLPRERLKHWRQRVYTLSIWRAEQKLRRCQKMLNLVQRRYQIVPTQTMLEDLSEPQEVTVA